MNTQTAQTAPSTTPEAPVYIMIDGRQVQALTPERLQAIIDGMDAKGRVLKASQDGEYLKGFKVLGDGNFYEGPIGGRFIYNTDVLSEVALNGNKWQEAMDQLAEEIIAANGDVEAIHNACRKVLNSVTVSFSEKQPIYKNGQLINASVKLVTTDKGSLITLTNTSLMEAAAIRPTGNKTINFGALLADRLAAKTAKTAKTAKAAPAGEQPAGAEQLDALN